MPAKADARWIGASGPGPPYIDEGSGGPENDFTNRNATFMTLEPTAGSLKDASGVPAHGNQRPASDAGRRFDFSPGPGVASTSFNPAEGTNPSERLCRGGRDRKLAEIARIVTPRSPMEGVAAAHRATRIGCARAVSFVNRDGERQHRTGHENSDAPADRVVRGDA